MKKMKGKRLTVLVLFLSVMGLLFFGCNNGIPEKPEPVSFSGGVFKGPFLVGSTVTIYPLDENLNQTGISYSGDIISEDGTYDISDVTITGPVELVATGYYFDEITGTITDNPITMRTITENTETANINLFSALETDRVTELYKSGLTISEAKEQAIGELFTSFKLALYQEDSGKINIDTANGAALLAVSSLFAYNRSLAEIQTLLTEMRVDFADGSVDTSDLIANAKYIRTSNVKANLEGFYTEKNVIITVPSFKDELWELYGAESVIEDTGNHVRLSSAETVELTVGFGHVNGFIIPDGTTVSFTINVAPDIDYVQFYEVQDFDSFTVSDNNHYATATGPGYFRLDSGVAYPPTPYDFTITVDINGQENTVEYQAIAQ